METEVTMGCSRCEYARGDGCVLLRSVDLAPRIRSWLHCVRRDVVAGPCPCWLLAMERRSHADRRQRGRRTVAT